MKSLEKYRLAIDIYKTAICILLQLLYTNMADVDTRVQLPARRAYSPEGGPGTGSSLKGSVCFITSKCLIRLKAGGQE
jgi:hypothetical protein